LARGGTYVPLIDTIGRLLFRGPVRHIFAVPQKPQGERDDLEPVAELFYRQCDELGFSNAALALLDRATDVLRIRLAVGFPNNSDVTNMIVPAKFASTVPLWIQRANGGQDAEFLDTIKSPTDLLALPLFGGRYIGMMCIGASREDTSHASLNPVRDLAERVGLAIAFGERNRPNLIIENVGHPVVVGDANGNLLLFNKKAELLFEQTGETSAQALAAIRTNSIKLTSFISVSASAPGSERQAEIELIEPETGNVLPMEITSVEITDPHGWVTAVVAILHDLSSIRELERRRVQQQLFESEKLAAIGRLTASIAHEINNPLEAIKNSLFLLQSGESDSSKRFLEIALKETERVSHIIAQMLGFTRGKGEIEWVKINELLDETLVLVDKRMRQAGTRIVREFAENLPKIHARADQLRQVFLNLLLNAQQSMQGRRGSITVRTASISNAAEPWISIEISDTGIGINDEDLTRIFEPFFSTRKKGTGLGLWVTQDIVRHHGGRIEVSSVVNRGTTFRIVLPLEPPAAEAQSHAALTA
jgi:PAS domain S-box-containing protein